MFRIGLAILMLLVVPSKSSTSELNQKTLKEWDKYLRIANLRMHRNFSADHLFLLTDEQPSQSQRLHNGEILVFPAQEATPETVPDGLIHDWIGAIFIPSAKIDEVLAVVHDYNRYQDFYKPTVIESRSLSQLGEEYKFSLLGLKRVFFEKIVLEAQFESQCSQLDDRRRYCVSYSTHVQEIQDYGESHQHKLPMDQGHGYVWRLYCLTKFEERGGGVYIEVEAIALSRDISESVRWLAKPVVQRISRDSMSVILQCTRDAVRSTIASCDGKDFNTCSHL
jgi:hypothetical protein